MAFNSDTYHANKFAKAAWADLAKARELRAEGNPERAALYASIARSDMHLSVLYRKEVAERRRARASVWASQ